MTVTRSEIHREGWTGSAEITGGNVFQVQWLVTTDDINDGPLAVVLGALNVGPHPIANVFDTYAIGNEFDSRVRLLSRSTALMAHTKAGSLWIVTGTYKRPGKHEEDDKLENPLLRPTKYRIDWANYTKVLEEDINGDPIVNAADQEFSDPIEIDDVRPVLVATRNLGSLSQVAALGITYQNSVNRDGFYGAAARHAKVESITAGEKEQENNVDFYRTTFRVQFNRDGWDKKIVNRGFAYYDSADQSTRKLVTAKNASDLATEPVLLAADGTKLPDGQKGNFKTFRVYKETSFSGMGI